MRSETESRAVSAVLLIWQTAGSDWVCYPLPTVLRSLIRHSEECLFATFPFYSVTSWVPKILLAYRLEKRAILKQIIIQNVPPSPASRTLHSKAKLQSITGGPPPLCHSAPPTSCSPSPHSPPWPHLSTLTLLLALAHHLLSHRRQYHPFLSVSFPGLPPPKNRHYHRSSPEPPAIVCLCLSRSKSVCSCCVTRYAHVSPDVCV